MSYRVAVITPYRRVRDDWFRKCLESVRDQSVACTHIVVADGQSQEVVNDYPGVQHIVLPVAHADFGDTPRAVGSMSAIGQGFDAICYLDADNWFRRDHVRSLLRLHKETGAVVLTSKRSFHTVDETVMGVDFMSDGEKFSDTSCLMLMRPAFGVGAAWALMHPDYHAIDDRIIWYEIQRRKLTRAHSELVSVGYRVTDRNIYEHLGWPAPPEAKAIHNVTRAVRRWKASGRPSIDLPLRVLVRKNRDWSDLTDTGPLLKVPPPRRLDQPANRASGAADDQ